MNPFENICHFDLQIIDKALDLYLGDIEKARESRPYCKEAERESVVGLKQAIKDRIEEIHEEWIAKSV